MMRLTPAQCRIVRRLVQMRLGRVDSVVNTMLLMRRFEGPAGGSDADDWHVSAALDAEEDHPEAQEKVNADA